MSNPEDQPEKKPTRNRWQGMLTAPGWLRTYERPWFRADLAAGITLAAYLLPAALGDASLAGLPPETGLYACLFGGLVFWLFCSSRQTSITVTSAISLLIGSTLGGMADGDPARYAAMASCTALLVAVIAFAAWLARAGSAVNFISETVMLGFKAGVALHLASTQLPKLFGVKGGHGDFWERIGVFLRHIGETHLPSLLVGVAALVLLVLGKKFLPNKPVALFIVAAGIIVASIVGLGEFGVKLLGEVPKGIPIPALPVISHADIRELLPLALACFLLGAVETAAIGKMFAEKHGYRLDANQELLALSGANLASGLGQGFPISGGMSQSLVNESGGARTPLSGLIAAVIVLLVALFFTDLLRNLPQPVLAAIIVMAVLSLFKVKELARLWKLHRSEFFIAMAALAGVLWAGLLKGVLIGAVISMVLLIRRAASPHVAFLGRIPGSRRFSDRGRHPENEPIPGVILFRVEASLVYFNSEHIYDAVLTRLSASPEPIHAVIWDLSTSPMVDVAGTRLVKSLHSELEKRGIRLSLTEARSSVRDMLRKEGVEEKVGRIDRFTTLADALDSPQPGDSDQSIP